MLSKAKRISNDRYIKNNWRQTSVRWKNWFVDELDRAIAESGESKASYIRSAIEDRMRRDGFELRVPQDEPNESEEQQETETEER